LRVLLLMSLGNNGCLMVLGLKKWRKAPNGGKYLAVSGPLPQPKPNTSNSMLHAIALPIASGLNHHCSMVDQEPKFEGKEQKPNQTRM